MKQADVVEAVCRERCAQVGDPPCSRVCDEPHCDECIGIAKAAMEALSAQPTPAFRYELPVGDTFDEMRENVRKTELYQRGDTVLVWVNEADLDPLSAQPTSDLADELDAMTKGEVDGAGYYPIPPKLMRRIITALRSNRAAIIEECAKVCERQRDVFLSPEYATNQPISSIQERFACVQCAEAIRSLNGGDHV